MNESCLSGIHLVSTHLIVGIIWFVQIVHYPLMESMGPEASPCPLAVS